MKGVEDLIIDTENDDESNVAYDPATSHNQESKTFHIILKQFQPKLHVFSLPQSN